MAKNVWDTQLLYTVPEVAAYLRCSHRTIFDLIHRGELAAIHVGRLTRIRGDALADYLAAHAASSRTER